MRRTLIAPSILSADFGRLADEVRAISAAGADYIHVDVMDGHFVPNLTIGPPVIKAVRQATKLPLDVHLMIEDPDRWVDDYAAAGADLICVHAEAATHLHRTIQSIRRAGKRPAVALNPATPIDHLAYVLDLIDMVLIMSVNPGFGGQSFISQVVPKIKALRAMADERGLDLDIEVDGGIKVDNVDVVAAAGANVIVSGSGIFGQGDYKETIEKMRARADVAAGEGRMKAIVISKFGGPEVLEYRDVPDPQPSRGEVRVRVHATAVNRADLLQRMGAYPAPPDAPADIPGLEFAGEVLDAAGDWKVGDRVFGLAGGGGYAEQIVVHARTLARVPDRLSYVEAAAIPEAYITAWDAMVSQAHLGAGETVLVHAAGSGVGTAALQIARAIGARAIGTARTPDKLERCRALGMDTGIVAEGGKFADAVRAASGGRGVDVILELVGGGYMSEDVLCVAPRGRIMLVGLMAGVRTEIDLALILRKRVTVTGTQLRARPLEEKIDVIQAFARHVVPLVADGKLAAVVDKVFPLAQAGEAHTYVAGNQGFGKVVLEA